MSRGYVIPVEKLGRARALRGWSVSELAQKSGVGIATVSRALAGRPVTMQTLSRLAAAFTQQPPSPAMRALLDGDEPSVQASGGAP